MTGERVVPMLERTVNLVGVGISISVVDECTVSLANVFDWTRSSLPLNQLGRPNLFIFFRGSSSQTSAISI